MCSRKCKKFVGRKSQSKLVYHDVDIILFDIISSRIVFNTLAVDSQAMELTLALAFYSYATELRTCSKNK